MISTTCSSNLWEEKFIKDANYLMFQKRNILQVEARCDVCWGAHRGPLNVLKDLKSQLTTKEKISYEVTRRCILVVTICKFLNHKARFCECSAYHSMTGGGFPSTWQQNMTSCPTKRLLSSGWAVTVGWTDWWSTSRLTTWGENNTLDFLLGTNEAIYIHSV